MTCCYPSAASSGPLGANSAGAAELEAVRQFRTRRLRTASPSTPAWHKGHQRLQLIAPGEHEDVGYQQDRRPHREEQERRQRELLGRLIQPPAHQRDHGSGEACQREEQQQRAGRVSAVS